MLNKLINCMLNYQPLNFTLNANKAELNAKVASPEIKHCRAHTPTKTTKQTCSECVLYVLHAFGTITNAFSRTMVFKTQLDQLLT